MCQDERHSFYCGLAGSVGCVGRETSADHRGREVEDRPARAQAAGGLLVNDEGASDVGPQQIIKDTEIQVDQRSKKHDARCVYDDIDAAEGVLGEIEECLD